MAELAFIFRPITRENKTILLFMIVSLFLLSCSEESISESPDDIQPEVFVRPATAIETESNSTMSFEVTFNPSSFTKEVSLKFSAIGITAEPNVDFRTQTNEVTVSPGTRSIIIPIDILSDDEKELDETFRLEITSATNASLGQAFNIGTIEDRDEATRKDNDGYFTRESHYGYSLTWQDEFSSDVLSSDDYSFDLGNGCPDLCGWGNDELEFYTADAKNISIAEGRLKITAIEEANGTFTSARIITKDKHEFKHGRIDIRAKLPKGQGIWPAIWMLGANIDDVGWPACGEIDIMEAIGHEPLNVYGTAHWGPEGGPNSYDTGAFLGKEEFSTEFHVFTILWRSGEIIWFVDEEEYHRVSGESVGNAAWRFDNEFYFLFNVAVGGQWPGNPDETTVFPQTMEIDYVRVFQPL